LASSTAVRLPKIVTASLTAPCKVPGRWGTRPLPRVARQGGTAFDSWPFAEPPLAPDAYAELAKHPERVAVFARAMAERSRGLGASILERAPDLREARHLVDLGGGDGTIARELLRAAPRLRITTVERGAGARLAERKTAAEGLGDRHAVVDADLRSAAVDPADAVLLAGVLADFPPGARADLLVRARDLLRPGGRLLVSETLLDPDRTSPPGAALLSLVLLAFAALPLAAQAPGEAGVSLPYGTQAPGAELEDLDGNAVQLLDYVGDEPAIVEFWATWCELCEALQPQFDHLQAEYGDRINIVAVGVGVNQNPRRIKRHLEENDPGYPHLFDARGAAVRAYNATTTSIVVMLDAEGQVVYTGVGADQDLVGVAEERLLGGDGPP